jgi:hypothetical protein
MEADRKLERRELLGRLGRALSLLAAGPLLARCGFLGGSDSLSDQTYTSTIASGHTHQFTIPGNQLNAPSGPYSSTTTATNGHTHQVSLAQDQLQEIAAYQQITITSSNTQGHTHDFTFG